MRQKLFLIFLIFMFVLLLSIWSIYSGLPSDTEIKNYFPESTVANFTNFNWQKKLVVPVRKYIPLSRISDNLKKPVIISEDDTFFSHSGINTTELKNVLKESWEKKKLTRGASTITMQVARNAFLHRKKTLTRKLKEIILTKRIEKIWTKRKILEYYLNIAEWGPNIYGAEAAAHFYFDKSAAQLTLAEGSLLAAILPNPNYYNPFKNYNGARRKQQRVLKLMRDARLIDTAELENILSSRIYLRGEQRETPTNPPEQYSSLFDSILTLPQIKDSLKQAADSTGIIFLPEEEK